MKFSEKLIRLGLILLVALSFYLSYVIWLSPTSRSNVSQDPTAGQIISNAQNLRKAPEIYLPLRLTWINETDVQETNNESLIDQVQDILVAGRFGTVEQKNYQNAEEFTQAITLEKGIELYYVAPFLLKEYAAMFDLNIDLSDVSGGEEENFIKFQIDPDASKIRFINYKRLQIYEATMTIDEQRLNTELNTAKVNWTQMTADDQIIARQYNTGEAVKLKMYSYISSLQSYAVFRDAFFNEPENVKTNEDSDDLVLNEGSENMTVQEGQQTVDFHGELLTDEDNQDIFSQSFHYISRLGTSLGNLRFFDRAKDTISYRVFVEGFPVFSEDYKGEVNVTIAQDGENHSLPVHIQTNLDTIQIPIPSDKEIELVSGTSVLETLIYSGAKEELLRSIIVGYQRQDLKDTSGVVDLVPTWYVKYDDQWYTYYELLEKLQEMEGE